MAASFLRQLERDYFVRKAGGAPNSEKLNSIKRRYYYTFLTGYPMSSRTSLNELEQLWLQKLVTDAGGTITDGVNYEVLWKQAVMAISKVPSKYLADNKITFFRNAP